MDLIDDIGNDLALAFLVEKKHRQNLTSQDVLALIRRIKAVLYRVEAPNPNSTGAFEIEQPLRRTSH
ncbi:MAG: hypothetical protein WKF92_09720 [Pyrinomonadaceae bacterium]